MYEDSKPPSVDVGPDADGVQPVKKIDSATLALLGQELDKLFLQYASDRRLTELKWMRNLRQYLGVYDPEIEKQLGQGRSRAYPRITRVKSISVLSRIMNLMFPGNERNWELSAAPSAEMSPDDVQSAVQSMQQEQSQDGGPPAQIDQDFVDAAVQQLADQRAANLSKHIDSQLQEIGGDQTVDFISLNRKVVNSGIMYGVGVLRGPYVRTENKVQWGADGSGGFTPQNHTSYKPQYDFLPVWDFYPDMSARSLPGEGYFTRLIMGRSELRKLANRDDFFAKQIKNYIAGNSSGNYKAKEFEQELRAMGTKANVTESKSDPQGKYEIIVWNGPVSAERLGMLGVDVPESAKADDIEAEIWMVAGNVIKADMNPWRKLGIRNMKTVHTFVFDENDTSPIGDGLPNVVRDSQMSICAATRMTIDNAAITCGPNLEINTNLLRADQDLVTIEAYKNWYRDDDGQTAQFPAVRKVEIDGHLPELQNLITMFMGFADMETFVGPATGGDMSKAPSEPMRTAAGASMLRGDAALPFKDIVRNFDFFTQSVILSLVEFNKKFNPSMAPAGDYCVIARGATSLIAKEVRGMQLDMLSQTLTPEERDHIDERKFVEQKFAVRDMTSLMVPEAEADRKKAARQQAAAAAQQQQDALAEANVRKLSADSYKSVSQAQKNSTAADATTAKTSLDILQHGLANDDGPQGQNTAAH